MAKPEWFGIQLKSLRQEAGLTQKALAERAGLRSEMGIRDIEQGRRNPAWETVLALCKALGCSADTFMQAPDGTPETQPGRPAVPERRQFAVALGRVFTDARAAAKLSLAELAVKAGLPSDAIIRDIEQGLVSPSFETMAALAKALGRSLDSLVPPPVTTEATTIGTSPAGTPRVEGATGINVGGKAVEAKTRIGLPSQTDGGGQVKPPDAPPAEPAPEPPPAKKRKGKAKE